MLQLIYAFHLITGPEAQRCDISLQMVHSHNKKISANCTSLPPGSNRDELCNNSAERIAKERENERNKRHTKMAGKKTDRRWFSKMLLVN
jgi:hypothetical protein